VDRVTLKDTILDVARRLLGDNADQVDLGQAQQDFLNEAADMGSERLGAYNLAEQYYCGEKGVPLLDRAKEYLERSGLPYTENFCRLIVLSQKRRLKLEGFQVEDDEAASDWLTNTWFGRRRGDRLQGVVHLETLKLGDGFVIVDWDTRRSRPRATWNDPRKVKPVYDDENGDELLYVAKAWATTRASDQNPDGRTIRRLNLYYPDRVEKWFSPDNGQGGGGSVWAPYLVDTDEGGIVQWPIPWTMNSDFGGEPIGIPVFHFREQPGAGLFGESVLRDPIRLQDALDKQSVDLHMVMDQLGWRWPWIAGLTEAQQKALQLAIGDIALLPEGAEMGQLDGQDPRPMMETLEGTIARMAVLSSTPLHELTVNGEQPSGESRKMAESSAVAAAEDRHVYLGNAWEDVARMANRLAVVFGDGTVPVIDPDAEVDAQWDSAATRDELSEAQTLLIHQELGASRATTLRRAGYDPAEEQELRTAEQEADPLTRNLIAPPGGDGAGESPAGGTEDAAP
jgi:hypothetical protein